jgi:hypothetical protein
VDVLQSSRDKDKIRRIRAEIAEQHESIMELISECAIRFNGLPQDLYTALTETNCLPLEEQPEARRAVRDMMLRLLARNEGDQQKGTDASRESGDDANRVRDLCAVNEHRLQEVDTVDKKATALNVYLGVLVALNGVAAVWIWPSHLSKVLWLPNPGMRAAFPVAGTLAMNIIMIGSATALVRGKKWGVDPFLLALLLWGVFQALLSTSSLPLWGTLLVLLLGLVLFVAPVAGILLLLCDRAGILPDGTEC